MKTSDAEAALQAELTATRPAIEELLTSLGALSTASRAEFTYSTAPEPFLEQVRAAIARLTALEARLLDVLGSEPP